MGKNKAKSKAKKRKTIVQSFSKFFFPPQTNKKM